MATLPSIPTTAIPAVTPGGSFPLLTSITISDLVGPSAANRQPIELGERTLVLREKVNTLVVAMNAITENPNAPFSGTNTFLPRNGDEAMLADLDMGAHKITNLAAAASANDALRRADGDARYLMVNGGNAMAAAIDMDSHKIENVTDGSAAGDAVNYGQLSAVSTLVQALPVQGLYTFHNVEINYESTITLAANSIICCMDAVLGALPTKNYAVYPGSLSMSSLPTSPGWYYLYLVYNYALDTASLEYNASPYATPGTFGTNVVIRRIGSFRIDGTGSIIPMYQRGETILYKEPYLTTYTEIDVIGNSAQFEVLAGARYRTNVAPATFSFSSYVSAVAHELNVGYGGYCNDNDDDWLTLAVGMAGEIAHCLDYDLSIDDTGAASPGLSGGSEWVPLNAAKEIGMAQSEIENLRIFVNGYRDRI